MSLEDQDFKKPVKFFSPLNEIQLNSTKRWMANEDLNIWMYVKSKRLQQQKYSEDSQKISFDLKKDLYWKDG